MTRNEEKEKKLNKKCVKLRNKNANYECLLKRMLYCPGNEHEYVAALGVSLVCHACMRSVFLVLKPPLSMIDAFQSQ